MVGKLNTEEIEEVLTKNIIGRIGCHHNGRTYIVPISYAYEEESACIYAISQEGLKLDMMRKNPKVCFEVDTLRDMANWKSVIAWGLFEEVKDLEERHKALKFLLDRTLPLISSVTTHFSRTWPFINEDDVEIIKGIVFRIHTTEKSGRFEENDNPPKFFTD